MGLEAAADFSNQYTIFYLIKNNSWDIPDP